MSGGKLLETLAGTRFPTPPIWLMRQAGRYLPEYRAVRATTKSFLEFCYTPEKAVEVTLAADQAFRPRRRDHFLRHPRDPRCARPESLVRGGRRTEARGAHRSRPVRQALACASAGISWRRSIGRSRETRKRLPRETALLGFAGAPFTLACYMIEGQGSRDFAKVKDWAYRWPDSFGVLIDLLVDAIVDHLVNQIDAGADAVQLFDSWAGMLPEEQLFRWSLEPMVRIAQGVRLKHPEGADHRLPARRRARRADVSPAGCLLRPVARHRHRRALGGAGSAAAHLRAGQSRSADAGGRRPRDGDRGQAHPRQARPWLRSSSISVTASCRRRRPTTSRAWSRSCATGSRLRAHDPFRRRKTPTPPPKTGEGNDPCLPRLRGRCRGNPRRRGS